MKKVLLSLAMCFGVLGVFGQQVIKSENLDDFTDIGLTGKLTVELIEAEGSALEIVLHDSGINKLKWAVNDGKLSMQLRPTPGRSAYAEVKIYHNNPIGSINVSGSELRVEKPINSATFTMMVSGGAKISATMECIDLDITAAGNSVVNLNGFTKYLTVRSGEKSKVDTRKVETISATVDAASGSEVYVSASERMVANAKSGATIFYSGNPAIFRESTSKIGMGANINRIQ